MLVLGALGAALILAPQNVRSWMDLGVAVGCLLGSLGLRIWLVAEHVVRWDTMTILGFAAVSVIGFLLRIPILIHPPVVAGDNDSM
jgi:hypothetical protein